MELEKVPMPEPSIVQALAMVGPADTLQHIPLAVTGAPPSETTFPPPLAEVDLMDDNSAVVTAGKSKVVNMLSAP
jgi:hypothetical protein